jgi:L-methionine (R)-S-oxide reductase
MAEIEFSKESLSKSEKYQELITQVPALLDPSVDWVANAANLSAALKEVFGWLWVGFYRKVSEERLQLGPFQGPVACTFIHKGKGVCGTVWKEEKALIVANVDDFPGHIACSSKSKSEIVLPVYKDSQFWGVLDADSENLNEFSLVDLENLKSLIQSFEKHL